MLYTSHQFSEAVKAELLTINGQIRQSKTLSIEDHRILAVVKAANKRLAENTFHLLPEANKRGTTPITEAFLRKHFYQATENAGNLPCFKVNITCVSYKQLTIAKWAKKHPEMEQEWQVWMDSKDLCRIMYAEQLEDLLSGLNAKIEKR